MFIAYEVMFGFLGRASWRFAAGLIGYGSSWFALHHYLAQYPDLARQVAEYSGGWPVSPDSAIVLGATLVCAVLGHALDRRRETTQKRNEAMESLRSELVNAAFVRVKSWLETAPGAPAWLDRPSVDGVEGTPSLQDTSTETAVESDEMRRARQAASLHASRTAGQ